MNLSDIKNSEFCYYFDKGFDHGIVRTYYLQRHPTKPNVISNDGKNRVLIPMLCHEVVHGNKILKSKDSKPDEFLIDGRYPVQLENPATV